MPQVVATGEAEGLPDQINRRWIQISQINHCQIPRQVELASFQGCEPSRGSLVYDNIEQEADCLIEGAGQ